MSIFKKHYERWYRFDKKIGNFCRDIRHAWERATNGYAEDDTWEISYWFLDIMPRILTDFKDNLHSHPGDITFEQWEVIISDMAFNFKEATDEFCSYKNKYDDTYPLGFGSELLDNGMYRMVDLPMTPEEKNNSKLHFEEERKIDAYKNDCLEKGMDLFREWFGHLWD